MPHSKSVGVKGSSSSTRINNDEVEKWLVTPHVKHLYRNQIASVESILGKVLYVTFFNSEFPEIMELFKNIGWDNFITYQAKGYYPNVVRTFYANMERYENGIKTNLLGKDIHLTSTSLGKILRIKPGDFEVHIIKKQCIMAQGFTPQEFLPLVMTNTPVNFGHPPLYKQLSLKALILHKLITNNILPRSGLHSIFLAFILLSSHVGSMPRKSRSTYIVHMDESLMPKVFEANHHWYSSILNSISRAMPFEETNSSYIPQSRPTLVYTYHTVLHGFSAVLSIEELEALKKFTGFVSAYSDKTITLDTTHTSEFLSLNNFTGLWPVSNYGEDAIIGVVDTGVWPESQSFTDCGMPRVPARWKGICQEGEDFNSSMCNLKLIGARYFNKGVMAANPRFKIPMNSPRDIVGHGTHTSSIAAGSYVPSVSFFGYAYGTARGIAPHARVAMYKALWEKSYASDIVAAIDQAVVDGVDVISLSLGLAHLALYEDPVAIASFGAMEKGVFVSAAAGNTGPALGTLDNAIPWVLTVAAGSIDRRFAGTLKLGNKVTIAGWTLFPANAVVVDWPLIYDKALSACNSSVLLSNVPKNAAIICEEYKNTSPNDQLEHVAASGVPAAIFVSSDVTLSQFNFFPCPGIVISPNDAPTVIKYATTTENAIINMKFQETFLGTKRAPAASSYTSRGPSLSYPYVLKPDIMAPGTTVLAAWVPNVRTTRIAQSWELFSDYNILTGTSMACPHASAVAALLRVAHPEWTTAAIRSAMITTANPFDNTFQPIMDLGDTNLAFASPLVMGSGQVNPNQALDPGLIYDVTRQDYINLLCSTNFTKNQITTITRSSSYNCSSPNSDLNYPSFIALYNRKSSRSTTLVQNFQRIVTNVGSGQVTYTAKVIPPHNSIITVLPQTLVFKKMYEKCNYTLTVRYHSPMNGSVSFGWLIWVEKGGNRQVRSPIVVAPMMGA
ncbi:subtilisin-like protease SBT3 [Malania oleifera]|uniref:subtilisin-like protease SBT3 n=1 Tax=Malania oleifera TaxID=397392 RepID=UPI0025ADF4F9|nr:subtilisin-like protease SBT3 [Malania oleifera]